MPFADAHKFWAGDTTETAYVPDLVRPGPIEGMLTLNYGGGGEETRLVCGYLESSEFLFAPVFRTLPEVLVEQTGEGGIGQADRFDRARDHCARRRGNAGFATHPWAG